MAELQDMRMSIGIDVEPFDWKVVYSTVMDLELTLNTYSKEGWDVFNVLQTTTDSAFQVIFRKQIEKPEEYELC